MSLQEGVIFGLQEGIILVDGSVVAVVAVVDVVVVVVMEAVGQCNGSGGGSAGSWWQCLLTCAV